jgi:hypothetical protein
MPAGSTLRARFNGESIAASVVGQRATLRRIVVLIDNSGSMSDVQSRVLLAASQLIQQAPAETQVAVVAFAQRPEIVQSFTTDKQTLLREINDYRQKEPAKGRTALFDAIRQAVELFGAPQAGDVVVAITDGGENSSKAGEKDVRESLLEFHTPIFFLLAIPTLQGYRPAPDVIDGLSTLDMVSQVSGGANFLLVPEDWSGNVHPELLPPAIGRLLNLAARYYEVAVSAPVSNRKHNDLKIELVDEKNRKMGAYTLLYPHRLPPCSASQAN